MDDRTDVLAQEVASELINDNKKKQNRVLSVTAILRQIKRESSKDFWKKFQNFCNHGFQHLLII